MGMRRFHMMVVFEVGILLSLFGCNSSEGESMIVSSPVFFDGEKIPAKYTCDGVHVSPPLEWSAPPQGTKSLVLIMDDPDASGWVHWVLFNLPPDLLSLPENIQPDELEPVGGVQGTGTTFAGYFGPCPPEGAGSHRYSFRVYALNSRLKLEPGARKEEVERAMKGCVLSSGKLVGTYSRQ